VNVGLYDASRSIGVAARLRVEPATDRFWGSRAVFTPGARDAVREGYRQAAGLVQGLPPRLDQHRVVLELPRPRIDGPSLGLPVALAFLAHWTGQAPPPGLGATGALSPRGVQRVGGVEAKARALALQGVHRVLVPRGQGGPGRVEVGTLADAVAALGWSELVIQRPESVMRIRRRVVDLCEDVRLQRLGDHRRLAPRVPPWMALADELRLCSDRLEGSAGFDSEVAEARCHAALAFAHAGAGHEALSLLAGVSVERVPRSVALLYAIARLATVLDGADSALVAERVHDLEQRRAETPESERRMVEGMALGTLGREALHDRRVVEALPMLAQAVDWHAAEQPWEEGRSLLYLAMAERMSGVDAMATLQRSRAALVRQTRTVDPDYYRQCLVFWFYEGARCCLALGDADRSAELALLGLSGCEELGGGLWPAVGLHRTAAWAFKNKNKPTAARWHQRALDELLLSGSNAALRRIQEEAQGHWVLDGEVY
jgi:hypothetical protein